MYSDILSTLTLYLIFSKVMVLGVLTAIGVTVVAGYVLGIAEWIPRVGHAEESAQQRTRVNELEKKLSKLKKKRSNHGLFYIYTFVMLFTFLIALAVLLYVTDFFRNKPGLATLLLNWRYWFSHDYKIFDYNYYGIAGVAIFIVVVILPQFFFLFKICFDIKTIEKDIKDVLNELEQINNRGEVRAVVQGGWVNVVICSSCCYCTCCFATVVNFTALAFVSVTVFVCYIVYSFMKF